MTIVDETSTVAIFDLDGTLTWSDTLLPFLTRYITARPLRLLRLWRLPSAFGAFVYSRGDRGVLKARLIRTAMSGDARSNIDLWAKQFVASLQGWGIFRPAALAVVEAHRQAGHHLVLMSASPDLYVPYVGRLLGFERTVCTQLNWRGEHLDGTLRSANCRGQEKLRQLTLLRSQYPGARIVAYGNSVADIAHMQHTDEATLVNAGRGARQLALALGLKVADWR